MNSHRIGRGLSALLAGAALVTVSLRAQAPGQTDPPRPGGEPVQPLSRGPIHEGFAQPTVFDPKPGLIVPKEPPKPVEEIPPEQKPEGENVAWIPGYWSWDAEASNFVWVSGTWRVMPPGRQWIPGYWKKVDNGHQWVSGFWAPAGKQGFEYLPTPPPSLEIGPSTDAPGHDHIWSPGCWRWHDGRYVWQAGYWFAVQPDWIWCPPCYTWTPGGCIYVDGFWDHVVPRRGLLFAPVCFDEPLYLDAGYYYSPRVCVDLGLITDHFFCWPNYRHYCFGNYYSDFHVGCGIRPWFSFHGHRHHRWCDPIFSHAHWDHGRRDPHWHARVRRDFDHRRLNDHARPDIHHKGDRHHQGLAHAGAGKSDIARPSLTKPVDQIAAKRDLPIKLGKIGAEARREFGVKSTELQRLRDQRGQTESRAARDGGAKPVVGPGRPQKLELPGSPIAAKPSHDAPKPRGGVKPSDLARPANLTQSRGDPLNMDRARPRLELSRPGSTFGTSPDRLTPRGAERIAQPKIEPRRGSQSGIPQAPRLESRPNLESRSSLNVRPPNSSAPRIDSGPRPGSAPKFGGSSGFSPAPRGGAGGGMPRMSTPSRSSSSPAMRGGSSAGGTPRSSGLAPRGGGGKGGGKGKR